MNIIPFFVEAGITGMFPIEPNNGMDIVRVRCKFQRLGKMGGIPKSEIVKGPQRIDEIKD